MVPGRRSLARGPSPMAGSMPPRPRWPMPTAGCPRERADGRTAAEARQDRAEPHRTRQPDATSPPPDLGRRQSAGADAGRLGGRAIERRTGCARPRPIDLHRQFRASLSALHSRGVAAARPGTCPVERQGVEFRTRWRWLGWDGAAAHFATPGGDSVARRRPGPRRPGARPLGAAPVWPERLVGADASVEASGFAVPGRHRESGAPSSRCGAGARAGVSPARRHPPRHGARGARQMTAPESAWPAGGARAVARHPLRARAAGTPPFDRSAVRAAAAGQSTRPGRRAKLVLIAGALPGQCGQSARRTRLPARHRPPGLAGRRALTALGNAVRRSDAIPATAFSAAQRRDPHEAAARPRAAGQRPGRAQGEVGLDDQASASSSLPGPSARACAAMRARRGPKTGGRARASAASGPSRGAGGGVERAEVAPGGDGQRRRAAAARRRAGGSSAASRPAAPSAARSSTASSSASAAGGRAGGDVLGPSGAGIAALVERELLEELREVARVERARQRLDVAHRLAAERGRGRPRRAPPRSRRGRADRRRCRSPPRSAPPRRPCAARCRRRARRR